MGQACLRFFFSFGDRSRNFCRVAGFLATLPALAETVNHPRASRGFQPGRATDGSPLVDPSWWTVVGLDESVRDRVRPFFFLHGSEGGATRAKLLRLQSAEEVAWAVFELELELRVQTVLSVEEFLSLRSPDSSPVGAGAANQSPPQ